jgi:hypothetical protein
MTSSVFKRILREEITRVLSEQTAPTPTPLSAENNRLVVAGKPTRIDVTAFGVNYPDVQVKKVVMQPDGTPKLTLASGSAQKEVHYDDLEKVKRMISTIQNGGTFTDSTMLAKLVVTPVKA